MSVVQEKSELRKQLFEKRKLILKREWELRSKLVIDKLKATDEFKKCESVHCFVSMNKRKEVNTHDFIKELLSSNKKLTIPATDFESGELLHSKLNSFDDLQENKWGVLEPVNVIEVELGFDLILIPLLAADRSYNRLGYGKGFYDRFLKNSDAIKIGLLFDEFILNKIPVEDFDQKLDILITDKSVYRRNNEWLSS